MQHNESSETIRTSWISELRRSAYCLGFLIGESGAAVLLSGGGVSPSPAKIVQKKTKSQLENGVKLWASPNGQIELRKVEGLVLTYTWLLSRGAAAGAIASY